MALTRPTLLSVAAWDATQPFTFTFTVIGGSQVASNQLTIRNNVSNTIVYQQTQTTYRYEHTVPANTLQNGVYYNATLITYDADGNASQASVPIQFWCYSTPTIVFTNIPSTELIANASFEFQFTYNQAEGEKINSYSVNLYNSFQTQISTSGTIYATDGTPPYSDSYLFAGFENNSQYYVEVVASTINGTQISSGLNGFTVVYAKPDLFTLVGLVNNCQEGYITLTSNIVLIEGSSNPSPPTYINGSEVDVTANGSWVKYDGGYSIPGNYVARAWFRKPTPYSQILQFSNADGQTVRVNYMNGYESSISENLQAYFTVTVTAVTGLEYYIYSNYIDILPDDEYYNVWLTYVNGIYQIQIGKYEG